MTLSAIPSDKFRESGASGNGEAPFQISTMVATRCTCQVRFTGGMSDPLLCARVKRRKALLRVNPSPQGGARIKRGDLKSLNNKAQRFRVQFSAFCFPRFERVLLRVLCAQPCRPGLCPRPEGTRLGYTITTHQSRSLEIHR